MKASKPSRPIDTTWAGLVASLTRAGQDKEGLWRPGVGATRLAESVEFVHALVLDYDRATSLEHLKTYWGGYEGVAHTTRSSAPSALRWRVVLRLARPVPGHMWGRVYLWARRHDPRIDRSCSDPGRAWFKPQPAASGHFVSATWAGGLVDLNLDLLEDPHAPPPRMVDTTPAGLPRYQTDPSARQDLGLTLGGRVRRGMVRRAACPSCGRRSVWWPLDRGTWAHCDHRNTCGWRGPLHNLEKLHGASQRR